MKRTRSPARWAALGIAGIVGARLGKPRLRRLWRACAEALGRPRGASAGRPAQEERRYGADRRSGTDRRVRDEGPPPPSVERRSGTDRRSGDDRRSSWEP